MYLFTQKNNFLIYKVGLTLTFWLTLRQFINEKISNNNLLTESTNVDNALIDDTLNNNMFASTISNSTKINSKIVDWLYLCLVKYWIFLSSGMLLLMSCQNPVVAYRIGYMFLFLYFITTFQLFYRFWRKTLFIFHLVVIIYSMIVLLLLYLFQFKQVPIYCKNLFHIDDKVLSSIGFEYFKNKEDLVVRLLTPTTFLIVNILQIHYFNKLWLRITDYEIIDSTTM